MIHVFSTGQVARLLDIPAHRIEYAHATGLLDEPQIRFLGKRVYEPKDVQRVALHFGVALDEAVLNMEEGKEST